MILAWQGYLVGSIFHEQGVRVVEITKKVILDPDQVQAIYFDLRSDQGQIF